MQFIKFRNCKTKRRRSGKSKRKRSAVPVEISKRNEDNEKTAVFQFNPDEGCTACNPVLRRTLTESLLEAQFWTDNNSKPNTSNPFSTGWTSDVVNLALFRKGRNNNLTGSGRVKSDNNKTMKSTLNRTGKTVKYLTSFKHLDDLNDYIVQYRQPKCIENVQPQGRPPVAHVVNVNSNFRFGSGK
ncbi:unnamed protein product [Echinostoma caproni]|uniref:Uncharacterized protein n=1 Tax=Echinostoma caproni TaxID=27848 RepID=A0A183ANV2_9TREM|nr:unnamed protein product [Echinostoma caproni]